jgi:signal transduction histidine kinase
MATVPAPQSRAALNVRPFFEDKARAFWTLQAVGWGGYLVLRGVSAISNGPSLEVIVPVIVETILGYCITLLLSTLYGYYRSLPRVTGVLLTIATLFAATLLYAVLDTVNFSYIQTAQTGLTVTRLLASMYVCFTVLAGWSALYFGINFYLIVEEQIDQMRDLEVQASSAQLAMLRYQLNPHFLFNTLNSISTLVLLKQTERANAMLSRLSAFLRYTLANEPTAHVTVAQEVETLKLYLEIEKMRFEDRLRPVFDIDPRAEQARLPSLLLQPLVENAIKYAVTPQEEGADIRVEARLVGDRVQIAVSDTGPGLHDAPAPASLSTGVGLQNIRERLVQAYGPDQRLTTRTAAEGGFSVTIEIPLQVDHTKREAA